MVSESFHVNHPNEFGKLVLGLNSGNIGCGPVYKSSVPCNVRTGVLSVYTGGCMHGPSSRRPCLHLVWCASQKIYKSAASSSTI